MIDAVQDTVLGLYIHAAGRFIQQADPGLLFHDAADQNLLLVAAGQLLHFLLLRCHFDIQLFNAAGSRFSFGPAVQESSAGDFL